MTLVMLQISAFRGFARGSRGLVGAAIRMTSTSVSGETGTESYRLFFKDGDKTISPWHDIVSIVASSTVIRILFPDILYLCLHLMILFTILIIWFVYILATQGW